MAQTIFLKRSSVPGKKPSTEQLGLGELAINTADGKVFLKKNDGTESVVEVGPVTSVAGKVGDVALTKADVGLTNVDNTADAFKTVANANTITNPRTISMTGDVTWVSDPFNGSSNVTGTSTLANSGVTAGTYPKVTVDAKGRVTTGASLVAADIPNLAATKITSGVFATARIPTDINITGSAGTATKLAAPVNINGVAFDGSADIFINATDATPRIASSEKGVANGVATLDSAGLIPANQLPSYVDDILEYATLQGFPTTGESGKIYVDLTTNKTYRWSGSAYVYITSGAVDSVAGKTGVVTLTKADVGLANVDNTADVNKPVSSAQQAALDLKVDKVAGKQLSTEDYTTAEKTKLAGIEAGAQVNTVTSVAGKTGAVTLAASDISGLTTVATSGSYNDLADKPQIAGEYTLPVATTTVLGGVKDGAGVTIAADGTLSADVTSVAGRTGAVVLTKSDVGLSEVDNTPDFMKTVARAALLTSPKQINGVTFDNSANITIADATKLPLAGGTMAGAITFAAGQTWPTFNQNTTGNAATATALATGRTIGMTGDVTWTSASFNGTGNVTGTATLANSGVTAGTYPKVTVDAKGRVTSGTSLAAADVPNLDADKITTGTLATARIPTGISITGNAATATKLETARTINGVSFDGTANITINAVDSTVRIASSEKGVANGVATLDANGLVPSTQLPSYVDDVLEYATLAGFPATGESGKIYVDLSTNKTYRWSGSAYVYITSGAVDSVAGKTGVVTLTKDDVGLSNVDNTADANKSVASAAQLTTSRNLWGRPFNGTANVTGALSGVTTIAMSSVLTNSVATGTAPFTVASTTRVANLNVATAGVADAATTAGSVATANWTFGQDTDGSLVFKHNGVAKARLATDGTFLAINVDSDPTP
jgi:phage-related tail fiber protein